LVVCSARASTEADHLVVSTPERGAATLQPRAGAPSGAGAPVEATERPPPKRVTIHSTPNATANATLQVIGAALAGDLRRCTAR